MKKYNSAKKQKIALPAQYSMSFPNNTEVLYIIFSINLNIGNDIDKGHYVCDLLDHNTGTIRRSSDLPPSPLRRNGLGGRSEEVV